MKGHLLNAILAVLFSVLIWSAVGAQLSETSFDVAVDYVLEVPRDVTIGHEGQTYTNRPLVRRIKVDVRGPRELISRLDPNRDISARRQLGPEQTFLREALASGATRSIALKSDVIATRQGLEILAVRPEQLDVTFSQVTDWETRVERPEIVGQPAEGFRVGKVTLDRTRVTVRGPASVRERNPDWSYKVEPVDVSGERESPMRVVRGVRCPAGANSETRVTVTIELVPIADKRTLRLPVRIVTAPREPKVEPLEVVIEPRGAGGEWACDVTLTGPIETLDALERALARERLRPGAEANLPVAFIRVEDVPRQAGSLVPLDLSVVGLPDGVTFEQGAKFEVRTTAP